MSKTYELKLKIKSSKDGIEKFKKQMGEAMNENVLPEMKKFLSEFLLGKDLKPGDRVRWDRFYSQKAGIITKAIMDKADKSKINLLDKNTEISVERLPMGRKGVQVVLSAKVSDEASKAFKEKNFGLPGVLRKIMNFDESTKNQISKDVEKALKEKGKF